MLVKFFLKPRDQFNSYLESAIGLWLLYILERRMYWEDAFCFQESSEKETFERWSVMPFLFPPQTGTPNMQTGGLQHGHSSNLSSSSFHKPGLTSGPAAICNEESNLCCLLLCSMAHSNDPGPSCSGGSQWHVSWEKTEVYPLPIACNSCCKLNFLFATESTSFLRISWCMIFKE